MATGSESSTDRAGLSEADHRQIRELIARYCWALDTGDGQAYADTFTPDGIFDRSSGGRAQGREQLTALVGSISGAPYGRQHWVTNLVLEGDGERATATCYLLVYGLEDGVIRPEMMASYDDRLARVDGRWLLTHRRVTRWPVGDSSP